MKIVRPLRYLRSSVPLFLHGHIIPPFARPVRQIAEAQEV